MVGMLKKHPELILYDLMKEVQAAECQTEIGISIFHSF